MSSLKIGIVSLRGPTLIPHGGGARKYVTRIASTWVEQGHEVRVLCAQERTANGLLLPTKEDVYGILVERVGSPAFRVIPILSHVRSLVDWADVIIENVVSFPMGVPMFAKGKPTVAIVHHLNGRQYIETHGLFYGLVGFTLEECGFGLWYRNTPFVVPSSRTASQLTQLWLKPSHPAVVITPGVERSYVPGKKTEHPSVVYIGRLEMKRKRVDHLIEAFRIVHQQMPDSRLVIAGDGPARNELIEMAKELPVTFLGYIGEDEKIKLLQSAWVFASPSINEGFGITFVEAAACGVPVVTYQIPGLDVLPQGPHRYVPVGDIDQLAAAILELMDPSVQSLAERQASYVSACYDWESSSARFLSLLKSVR